MGFDLPLIRYKLSPYREKAFKRRIINFKSLRPVIPGTVCITDKPRGKSQRLRQSLCGQDTLSFICHLIRMVISWAATNDCNHLSVFLFLFINSSFRQKRIENNKKKCSSSQRRKQRRITHFDNSYSAVFNLQKYAQSKDGMTCCSSG